MLKIQIDFGTELFRYIKSSLLLKVHTPVDKIVRREHCEQYFVGSIPLTY